MAVLMRGVFGVLLSVLLSGLLAAPLAAQPDAVGHIVELVPQVWGTPSGENRAALAVDSPVLLDMLVEVAPRANTVMTFYPEGTLQLGGGGQGVQLVVDRARVDAVTGRHDSVLRVLLGRVLGFFSPSTDRDVEITTPSARLGIRGTVVGLEVAAGGTTVVEVLEGEVDLFPLAGGRAVRVLAGFTSVVVPGRLPTPPTRIDPGSWTLTVAADTEPFYLPQEGILPESPVERERSSLDSQGYFPFGVTALPPAP